MARVNVDILGISELKWTGLGEFNSDDHYIYYCGQESLRRNGVAIIINKRVWNAVLGYILKNDRMIAVGFKGKLSNITIIQVYTLANNVEEAEVKWFYEDLQDLQELIPPKDDLFIIGDWNAKVGRQETSEITGKFGIEVQDEAGQRLTVLSREHTSHSKHPFLKTQEKTLQREITRWSILKSDWLYYLQPKEYMQNIYSPKNSIQSAKTRPEVDCGLDHQLFIAQFKLKLKKTRKKTRPARYGLNQIPYELQ